jgi:hypothetical protein
MERGQTPLPSQHPQVSEFRNPDHPWPDRPDIPEFAPGDPYEFAEAFDDKLGWMAGLGFEDHFEPPSENETEEENTLMLRRQCLFRWTAICRSGDE